MRTVALIAMCIAVTSGCVTPVRPVSAPPPETPFADDPVSFTVSVRRFTPGEVAIVKVCVASDRSIISADVIESSGDARFDHMALGWAQAVRMRSISPNATPVPACGQVRVEVRAPNEPRVFSGSDTALG
jgi:hypothetical protein